MIIWINGAFGIGKSTIAETLNSKIKNSHIYDPEQVGYFLWNNFPDSLKRKGDFQDINIWRNINYEIIKYMYHNYNGTLIIPMTIVNKEYYNDIIGNLINDNIEIYHFILTANKSTIKTRLINRGEISNSWPEQQIDRCLEAFATEIEGIKINTDNLTIEVVTDIILRNVNLTK
ncbi:MAG: AAA family ATPase [Clostridiaceae bacterium]|nr:AAA family ATPase [Clostridiaceae bacterium]